MCIGYYPNVCTVMVSSREFHGWSESKFKAKTKARDTLNIPASGVGGGVLWALIQDP